MPIENRKLKPGARLIARYKGREHNAEVIKTEEGLRYRLEDGREFTSPSAAGSAVMGGVACNGWRFWSLEGKEPRGRKGAKAARKGANDGLISRLDDGRWFCSACMEAFEAPRDVEPQGCPQGHRAEGSDA